MKNKKSFFETFNESHGKITTNIDEQIDMQNEKPDDGENPDKKTKSENQKNKRASLPDRIKKSLNEVLNHIKKANEGMQESGDELVNEKNLQKKHLPSQVRQDKEPMDTPLEIDELSYSKKDKSQKILLPQVSDTNTAKEKIKQIEEAWKKNKGFPFT
jgi:hypothetical protein